MTITPENIVRHELIGLKIKIAESSDASIKNLSGKVVDETYNTLKIETKEKEKTVTKKDSVFVFTLPSKIRVQVDGSLLMSRPEDRIKKKFAKW